MNRSRITWLCLVLALVLGTGAAFSQGLPTGSISGRIENEGQGLPGVSVTAKSPNLQGVRTTVTSVNGDYYFANLPPGQYTIRMELSGFAPHEEQLRLGATQQVTVNASMALKAVEATATVIARSEQVSTGAADAATYTGDTLSKLPTARTMLSAVNLAPGVNNNGPSGAITISGASSYENNMMVDGANIQDNIRNTPTQTLLIEDAVQETTTTSSGVSAEWGRFTGGVVNTITKSGGNNFSGSFRATLNNDKWRELTPFPTDKLTDKLVPTYEATLGGPFWKDHVWFFGAFRSQTLSGTTTLAAPVGLSIPTTTGETRWEGKLTITPVQNQTITGTYVTVAQSTTNYVFPLPAYDLASVYDRQNPHKYWLANYNGVLSESLFLEGQYSEKHYTFANSGSRYTDLVQGTVMYGGGAFYNSPIFCAVCPGAGEKRDNQAYFGKLNWFVSTKGFGSHNMVGGYDAFNGSRLSNNWQSGSSYFVYGDGIIYQGGEIYPVIETGTTTLSYYPIFNIAQPSATDTWSLFFNDTWKLNDNLSFNLGVRYDKNHATDASGATTAQDSKWSPRLAAIWDVTGKGTFRVSATYATYVAAPAEGITGNGTGFGTPAGFYYYYDGPSINSPAVAPLVTRAQALQQVFNWYGITAPNQFPKAGISPFAAVIPGVNQKITPGGLVSPSTTEWTAGVGGSVGRRFTYRVDGIYRNYTDFYVTVKDMTTGQVVDPYVGDTYDLGYITNGKDPLVRKYYGLHTNMQWRPWDSLNIGASWTWSHTYGNTDTENVGSGPISIYNYDYPEYQNAAWSMPEGNLTQDQRHRVRAFGTWDIPFPKSLGHLSLGFLYSLGTGLGYGAYYNNTSGTGSGDYPAISRVNTTRYVTNPGYATPPPNVPYYYTARDAFRTPMFTQLDLSLNYGINVGPVEIFVSPQVLNVFNGATITANSYNRINQVVETSVSRPANYAAFNPFTTVPVQGARSAGCNVASPPASCANWNYGTSFGQATSSLSYQQPQLFRISMGVRF